MMYYNFQNYEGFKERFGVRVCGNGEKSRKNKILLSYVKQPELLRNARLTGDYSELNIVNMTQLWHVLTNKIHIARVNAAHNLGCTEGFYLCGVSLRSKHYRLDELEGVCEDGDTRSIRYVNLENNRVFKMKAGRFFNKCIEDMGLQWPEPVRLWMCEEFQRQWEVYASQSRVSKTGELELYVDDNFSDIYDSDECDGDFGSCMVDDGQWYFYRDAVNAQAAYLRRTRDGQIVARCIIFNEVRDDRTGEILRLAERQYSTDGDEVLKRLLVDALIKDKKIDGYKKVGVGCHDNQAYVGVDGSDWSDRHFSIECNLNDGDTLSYQDSFVYYDIDCNRAYNYDAEDAVECLNDTSSRYRNYRKWDEYNQRWITGDLYEVYYDGEYHYTDYYTREDDFTEIDGTYYLTSECTKCPECGEYMHENEGSYYSELTNEEYCCDRCRRDAEYEYRRNNFYYSEFDDKWYENEEDVTTFKRWHPENRYICRGWYTEDTISVESLNKMIDREEVILCDGIYCELPYTNEWNWMETTWGDFCRIRVRNYFND